MTYRINGKLVTKDEWDASPKVGITPGKTIMGFVRESFVSPIDGTVISSAADLRAHEKKHNVIQVGNEYVGVVNDKREERRQLQSDMGRKVREAEKNGMRSTDNFQWQ